MPVSAIEIYKNLLPKTNCGDCGQTTCFAFATLVVVEKMPLDKCPHIDQPLLNQYQNELNKQHAEGKWVKKDIQSDAFEWAKERSASMNIEDLPERIGGHLLKEGDSAILELPYFNDTLLIRKDEIAKKNGSPLNRWEQVFLYNHMAQGGNADPTGKWKSFEEFPNTISKIKSMKEHVENPIIEKYKGKVNKLIGRAAVYGGVPSTEDNSADAAILIKPLPKIPILLLFWDEDKTEGFEATLRLLFDETVIEHLDIESIMFLSERIRQLLCDENN